MTMTKKSKWKLISPGKCPKCKIGNNSEDLGGNKNCFHCGRCGYVECTDRGVEQCQKD